MAVEARTWPECFWCVRRLPLQGAGRHCPRREAPRHLLDEIRARFIQDGWSDSRSGGESVSTESADFELIANLAELEEIEHGEEVNYRPADIVDSQHPNCTNAPLFRRKGAVRDHAPMSRHLMDNIEAELHKAEMAALRVQRYRHELATLEALEQTVIGSRIFAQHLRQIIDRRKQLRTLEASTGIEPVYTDLQSAA